ncbi:MAG: radical SAM protein [Bacteroidaceae bacterium]|nr:radical SAM protein [Bacteroidaceae bacterium]
MTILYPSPIFGPVHSRRLGVSLGINLMPADGKLCTFDCIYCECGFNSGQRPKQPRPTREQVSKALRAQLEKMAAEGVLPDVLTFAGNGEPTAHPDFPDIIADTIALRDEYCPSAKVAVLSNATMTHRPEVFSALLRVDDNIQKLDTVSPDYIRTIDRPVGAYDVDNIVKRLADFNGHVMVQTLFMQGTTVSGADVDNTSDDFVRPWLNALRTIRPEKVMVYTIDRDTPDPGLRKAPAPVLDAIAAQVRAEGFEVSVSY